MQARDPCCWVEGKNRECIAYKPCCRSKGNNFAKCDPRCLDCDNYGKESFVILPTHYSWITIILILILVIAIICAIIYCVQSKKGNLGSP